MAHRTRNQGLTHKEARDLFAFLKFRIPFVQSGIITLTLPPNFPAALRANLRRVRTSALKRYAGVGPKRASLVLERILSRMIPTASGWFSKPTLLNQEETDVFMFLTSYAKGGSLFTDQDIFKDFIRILTRMRLLKLEERSELKKSNPLSLFSF